MHCIHHGLRVRRLTLALLAIGLALACGEAGVPSLTPAPANAPPEASVTTPAGLQVGAVTLSYRLIDADADVLTATIEYSTDGGASFALATPGAGGDGQTGLVSAPAPGITHTFVWDSVADGVALGAPLSVRLRVTPSDGRAGQALAGTTADFRLDNRTPVAAPVRLAIVPGSLWLDAPGAIGALIVYGIDAAGARGRPAGITFTPADPGIATVDAGGVVTAVGYGSTTITASDGVVSRDASLTVGPRLVLNTRDALVTWDAQSSALGIAGPLGAFETTFGTIAGDTAYFVEGNHLDRPNRLRRIELAGDPAGWTETVLDFDAGPAAGFANNPRTFVVRQPDKAYLVSSEPFSDPASPTRSIWGVTIVEPGTMTVTGAVALPDPAPGEEWSPEGACLVENRLFVVCTGFHNSAFSWGTPAVFVIDTETDTLIDVDPATPEIDPIVIAGANPQRAIVGPLGRLFVVCTGTLGWFGPRIGASVEVYDPVSFERLATLPLGANSYGGGPLVLDRRGVLYIASGLNGATAPADWGVVFYSIDTRTLTVRRDASRPLLVPDATIASQGVFGAAIDTRTNTLYFASYNTDTLITLSLDDDDDLSTPFPGPVTRTPLPSGQAFPSALVLRGTEREAPVHANRVVAYAPPAASFNDPTLALGAPLGGGGTLASLDVVTVEAGAALTLAFDGWRCIDRPGADFVLYENAVNVAGGGGLVRVMEPARVQVSQDGATWFAFPASENAGYATTDPRHWQGGWVGVTPTFATPAAAIPLSSWAAGGDRFDLADVGLAWARYVRVAGAGQGDADIDALFVWHAEQD